LPITMRVNCTECNQLCRRKVVNRGVENVNRIYYKCEACNHKVGWEDELIAGRERWTKQHLLQQQKEQQQQQEGQQQQQQQQQGGQQQQQQQQQEEQQQQQQQQPASTSPSAPQPPSQHHAQGPATRAATTQPLHPKPAPGEESDVEFVFERPAPQVQEEAASAKAAGAKTGPEATAAPSAAPVAQSSGNVKSTQGREAKKQARVDTGVQGHPASNTRSQRRQVSAARPSGVSQQPAQLLGTAQQTKQIGAGAETQAQMAPGTEASQATGPKRKFDQAFADSAGRPGKRVVQDGRPDAAPAVGVPTGAASTAASPIAAFSTKEAAGSLPKLRTVPLAGAMRTNGVCGTTTVPVCGPAGGVGVSSTGGGGPGGVDNVFRTRGIRVTPLVPPPTGSPAAVFTAARPATAPHPAAVAASAVPSPFAVPPVSSDRNKLNPELEDPQLIIRNLRRELAVANARVRDEHTLAQAEAAKAEALRLRLEPLDRELRELRQKYSEALQREKQLTDQLGIYKVRERTQQMAAQQAAAAAAAVAAAAQQAAAQQAAAAAQRAQRAQQAAAQQAAAQQAAAQQAAAQQAAAQQAAAQQTAAQQAARTEYAKQYGGFWNYQHFSGHGVPQQEFEGAWFGGAAPGNAQSGRCATGTGWANGTGGGSASGPDSSSVPNGAGAAAGGRGGPSRNAGCANGGGSGAGAAPPPPDPGPDPGAPRDDPALLAFACSPLPVLDENTSVRALKQFLAEAGAETLAKLCAEKTELLELARNRINGWEIRRALACSRLANQALGDRALFRLGADLGAANLQKMHKELRLRFHPDKNMGDDLAKEAFQYLQLAYTRLTKSPT
ncbi:hypothetical protein VaNZ11_014758, partial [Volvox africanus]